MLTAQLFGTGRQWRPLDQALDVLWQASAWREELIQLLILLAERADRRLHPLPSALPVPLRVHGHYTRAEIEAAFGVLSTETPWIHREGVLWHEPSQCHLLFVTWPSVPTCSTGIVRAPPPLLPPPASATSTTRRAAHGCCCLCGSSANKMAAPAPPPNRSCVWGLQPMKATKASGRWRSAGVWSGRSRRRGYRWWLWRFEGGQGNRPRGTAHDQPWLLNNVFPPKMKGSRCGLVS